MTVWFTMGSGTVQELLLWNIYDYSFRADEGERSSYVTWKGNFYCRSRREERLKAHNKKQTENGKTRAEFIASHSVLLHVSDPNEHTEELCYYCAINLDAFVWKLKYFLSHKVVSRFKALPPWWHQRGTYYSVNLFSNVCSVYMRQWKIFAGKLSVAVWFPYICVALIKKIIVTRTIFVLPKQTVYCHFKSIAKRETRIMRFKCLLCNQLWEVQNITSLSLLRSLSCFALRSPLLINYFERE